MILNAQTLAVLFQAYSAAFKNAFGSTEDAKQYEKIAMTVPSSTTSNTYAWLGSWPRMREWLGDRVFKNLTAYGYSITNKKFEASVEVPRDALEDDQYGVYTPLFQGMGNTAANHPNEMVFKALQDGLTTGRCYDGLPFFSTVHPLTDANGVTTTFSNLQAGPGNAWYLLDTRTAMRPIVFQKRSEYEMQQMVDGKDEQVFMRDMFRFGVRARVNVGYTLPHIAYASQQPLSPANFDLAMQAMMSLKDDQGRPMGIRPNLLVVGPSNRAAANATIKAALIPITAAVAGSGTLATGGNTNTNLNAVDVMETGYLP
jgi:phage major head subunit gpT-like protein